jgi:site-specific DNA-methyltransferase (adenine-specific)
VDKIQGNKREVVGDNPNRRETVGNWRANEGRPSTQKMGSEHITKGTSPYEGYGTALKPAHEPCVLARKPLEKGMTVATNALKHGTGGLNIDGSRVGFNAGDEPRNFGNPTQNFGGTEKKDKEWTNNPTGRFPANFIHDGSDEVVGLFPDTGKSRSGGKSGTTFATGGGRTDPRIGHDDNGGSAARFFYCAKSSKSERNLGLEGFEEKEGIRSNAPRENEDIKTPLRANHHPTVKPLSLTNYLATLIKPPTGGRLLVPFSGSGSEMIGALQAGWEYVEGVELTEEYIPIAEARIEYWTNKDNKLL